MGERLPTKKRKQQLASEALRIIGNKGRAGLTAQSLGHAVGISDGAVFKHFPNMDSIVDAAIDRFQVLLKIEDPGITDPFERLRDFFFSRLALVQANPELLELAFSQSLEQVVSNKGATRVRRVIADSIAYIKSCLKAAQRFGDLQDGANITVLTWMVHGVLQAAARQRLRSLSPEHIWDQILLTLTVRKKETS